MTTPVEVRDRVMALCARIQLPSTVNPMHVYKKENECSFEQDELPAMVVKLTTRPREYNYTSNANRTRETVFEILMSLYVSTICDESYTIDIDSRDSADNDAELVLDTFAARPTLSMNYDGGVASEADIQRSTGPHTMDTTGAVSEYRGLHFRMAVTLRKTVPFDDE